MKRTLLYLYFFFTALVVRGQEHPFVDLVMYESPTKATTLRERLDDRYNYVVMFSTTWCYWCKKALRDWQTHLDNWRDNYDMKVVVVLSGSQDSYHSTVSKYKSLPYDLYVYDGSYSDLGISGVPHSFILNRSRKVLTEVVGYRQAAFMEGIFDNLNFEAQKYLDGYTYTVTLNKGCENEETIEYTSRLIGGSKYWVEGENDLDLNILASDIIVEENSQQELFSQASIICQDFSVYDPMSSLKRSGKIIDTYTTEDQEYIVTDIPIHNCLEDETYFTVLTNTTTNAGLVPIVNESGVISTLECVHKDGKYIVYGDSTKCQPSSTDYSEPSGKPHIYPNPVNKYLRIHGVEDLAVEKVCDVLGRHYRVSYNEAHQSISVDHLPKGIYHVQIVNKARVYTLSFIKR